MDTRTFQILLEPDGQQTLAQLRGSDLNEDNTLRYLTDLRKSLPKELAEAAVETALLRKRARSKFLKADQMYFTREALEQASGAVISTYRAKRYAPCSTVGDLACGIGGDAIPLASYCRVLAVDKDPLRLAMARENARVCGVQDRIEFSEQNLTEMDTPDVNAIFFDPARRSEGRRTSSVQGYSPPLAIIDRWLEKVPAIGVKISPAVKLDEITWDCEIEFISVDGDLKEAVLWFGPLRSAERRATLLPAGETLVKADDETNVPVTEPKNYLYEPDPAVIRSGLVETLANIIGASKLDEDIAYLTSDDHTDTPFARRFKIEEVMPFGVKKLNERLRTLDVGSVIVKKRGSPLSPEELRKKLKLSGTREIIVVLTHLAGSPGIILCTEDNH